MKAPSSLLPGRIRTLPKSFSWIDRRVITESFLALLTQQEIALYFFLVTAADRQGMSFWGHEKIQNLIGLDKHELKTAIHGLVRKNFIAYRYPFFQVLSIPQTLFTTGGEPS